MEEVGPRLEQRTKAAQEQLPDAQERSLLALTTCFRASLAPGVGYRIPPLTAKRPPRHFRPRRRLPPLPPADHHQTHDPVHDFAIEPCRYEVIARFFFIAPDVNARVEQLDRRQRTLIVLMLA